MSYNSPYEIVCEIGSPCVTWFSFPRREYMKMYFLGTTDYLWFAVFIKIKKANKCVNLNYMYSGYVKKYKLVNRIDHIKDGENEFNYELKYDSDNLEGDIIALFKSNSVGDFASNIFKIDYESQVSNIFHYKCTNGLPKQGISRECVKIYPHLSLISTNLPYGKILQKLRSQLTEITSKDKSGYQVKILKSEMGTESNLPENVRIQAQDMKNTGGVHYLEHDRNIIFHRITFGVYHHKSQYGYLSLKAKSERKIKRQKGVSQKIELLILNCTGFLNEISGVEMYLKRVEDDPSRPAIFECERGLFSESCGLIHLNPGPDIQKVFLTMKFETEDLKFFSDFSLC